MSTHLYPRLARELARPLIQELRDREPTELLDSPELLLEGHTFAPIGGRQVSEQDLEELREELTAAATECGFPDRRGDAERLEFDRRIAQLIHTRMMITPHQAADEEIWTHLSLGPLIALVAWRFKGLPDERVLGRARNTFRKLWWRAETLGPPTWDREGLREDETVQIMERTGISASPPVARALAAAFRRRIAVDEGIRRQDLMRDAMKRVNRLTPFVRLESLSATAVTELFDELFAEAANGVGGGTGASVEPAPTGTPDEPSPYLAEAIPMSPAPLPEADTDEGEAGTDTMTVPGSPVDTVSANGGSATGADREAGADEGARRDGEGRNLPEPSAARVPEAKTRSQGVLRAVCLAWLDGDHDETHREIFRSGIQTIERTDPEHAARWRSAMAGSGIEPTTEGTDFRDVKLGSLMQALVRAVSGRGTVRNDELSDVLEREEGIAVPPKRRRLLNKLAWSARARGLLEFDEGTEIWSAGAKTPEFDDRFGNWTYAAIVARATELLAEDQDPFEELLGEISGGARAPRIVASVVGSALNEARRSAKVVGR